MFRKIIAGFAASFFAISVSAQISTGLTATATTNYHTGIDGAGGDSMSANTAIDVPIFATAAAVRGSATARAYYGVLGGFASFNSGDSCFISLPCNGASVAHARWVDQFTILGGTGQGVLEFRSTVHGSMVGNSSYSFGMFGDPFGGGNTIAINQPWAPIDVDQSFFFAQGFTFGQTFSVAADLHVRADSGLFNGTSFHAADFANTVRVTSLVVRDSSSGLVIEGALIGTGSGVDYNNLASFSFATPVPEPESYAMLFAGLALLGFAAKRRKLKETSTTT